MVVAVSHVGICVEDLDRAERFYVDALGFTRVRELRPPDPVTSKLLQVTEPVGLTAVYLECESFTLELLHFDREGRSELRHRPMTEPGLTHLSMVVDDIPAVLERVRSNGGEVLVDTDVEVAILVRDPDGQIIELVRAR